MIYIYTSIVLNYAPKARVLAQSIKKFAPGATFCLLVSEPIPSDVDLAQYPEFDEVITNEALGFAAEPGWIFEHTLVEMCTAVKGAMLRSLLERPDAEAVIYFDPDIVLCRSLESIMQELRTCSVLLTPHLLDAESSHEAILDNELCALQHGVYNLGFVAVRKTEEGARFARWWEARLQEYCFADIPAGMFTDQRWCDLAPAYFPDLRIVHDRSWNVATWNIAHRHLAGEVPFGITVNGAPLTFYHFSGFDSGAQLAMLTKYARDNATVFALRDWYIAECARLDVGSLSRRRWKYDFFSNGERIQKEQRTLYRHRGDLQHAFPNPFAAEAGDQSFYHWYRANGPKAVQTASAEQELGWAPKNVLEQFVWRGSPTGPMPHPLFDGEYYRLMYPDIRMNGANPFVHFVETGASERRDPHPLFESAFYTAQLRAKQPEVTLPSNLLLHYVTSGAARDLSPHPLFDPKFYSSQGCSSDQPLIHYVERYSGGLDPHPLFNTKHYLTQWKKQDPNASGNPLIHFCREGAPTSWIIPSGHHHPAAGAVISRAASALTIFVVGSTRTPEREEELQAQALRAGYESVAVYHIDPTDLPQHSLRELLAKNSGHDRLILEYNLPLGEHEVRRLRAAAYQALEAPLATVRSTTGHFSEVSRHPAVRLAYQRLPELAAALGGSEIAVPFADSGNLFVRSGIELSEVEPPPDSGTCSTVGAVALHLAAQGWMTKMVCDRVVTSADSDTTSVAPPDLETLPPAERLIAKNHIAYRPLSELNLRTWQSALAADGRRRVLCFAHPYGGGTEHHLRDLADSFGDSVIFIFVRVAVRMRRRLVVSLINPDLGSFETIHIDHTPHAVSRLAVILGVDLIHVHHVIGLESTVQNLIAETKLPYVVSLHDYYLMAPNAHLTNGDRFAGEPDDPAIESVLCASPFVNRPESLTAWRAQWEPMLRRAETVLAPSVDVRRRFTRCYPGIDCKVVPHPSFQATGQQRVRRPALAADEPLHVVVLGAVGPHKGADLLEQCAILAKEQGLPLTFTLIGYAHRPLREAPAVNLRVLGKYDPAELPNLIQQVAPHVAWFPATCPESFCYTLSEAFVAGLPVAVSDLGALPERVAGREWSWVVPWHSSAKEWLEVLLQIRSSLQKDTVCTGPGTSPTYDAGIYELLYRTYVRAA